MKLLFSLLSLCFFFTQCTPKKEGNPHHFQGSRMSIPYDIQIAHPLSAKEKRTIETAIQETFDEINAFCNHWNEHSELSCINRLKSYEALLISDHLHYLFTLATELYTISNKKFDPTLRPCIQQLKNAQESSQPFITGWNQLTLCDHIIIKKHDDITLDFDAITKGYAVDLLAHKLLQLGYHNCLINWGGEIKGIGRPHPTRQWSISIRSPYSPHLDDAIDATTLENESIATSGDYMQRFMHHESVATHLIDPATQNPLYVTPQSIASVSIKAKSCALADGLATIAMFLKEEEIDEWVKTIQERYPEVSIWIVRHDGGFPLASLN